MTTWVHGKIIKIILWTDHLFSIKISAKINTFTAGQFTKIGLKVNNNIIQRAYSYLNAPNSSYLEFYITKIISGKLTESLYTLKLGDTILISKESYGKFVLNTIPNHCSNLWMFASGTGISPYLSMLASHDKKTRQFSKIILVHATRYSKNLNYLSKMIKLQKSYQGKLIIQTILSQEQSHSSLYGRIPKLIENNLLEKTIGLHLNNNSHIMLCGNPQMIIDTKNILNKKYGIQNNSQKNISNITQERYW